MGIEKRKSKKKWQEGRKRKEGKHEMINVKEKKMERKVKQRFCYIYAVQQDTECL